MKTNHRLYSASLMSTLVLLTIALVGTALGRGRKDTNQELDHHEHEAAKTLYVWAGDQARVAKGSALDRVFAGAGIRSPGAA